MAYVCEQLQSDGLACKKWVEVPPSPFQTLAITKEQAYDLTAKIVLIFIIVYVYKIVERNFFR